MMAAMMLPGAIPAIARLTHSRARMGQVAVFVGSYLAVWALVGAVVYAIYRPHGTSVAGAAVLVAGVYELTPVKRHCRRRCRESVDSGLSFGAYCVGSSIGLMAISSGTGRDERDVDGGDRGHHARPEAGWHQCLDRCTGRACDRRIWDSDPSWVPGLSPAM
jgi:predicted metal-binding membrane protein